MNGILGISSNLLFVLLLLSLYSEEIRSHLPYNFFCFTVLILL